MPKPVVTEERIQYAKRHVQAWTHQHITAVTDVESHVALAAAMIAADAWAKEFAQALRDCGVDVQPQQELALAKK